MTMTVLVIITTPIYVVATEILTKNLKPADLRVTPAHLNGLKWGQIIHQTSMSPTLGIICLPRACVRQTATVVDVKHLTYDNADLTTTQR